jgi:ribosomal protein S18 acetylase RimI-like enzyme
MFEIKYITVKLIPAWRAVCETVASERVYLGRVALPPFDPERSFPHRVIANNWPMYCAMKDGRLVGWADITPVDVPECAHRGVLGMGVAAAHRGAGIGSALLEACLAHAPKSNIEKIELTVFASNAPAIALYRKFGFTDIGVVRDYRRLDGITYDALLMERWV